jgi:hypothetical protein
MDLGDEGLSEKSIPHSAEDSSEGVASNLPAAESQPSALVDASAAEESAPSKEDQPPSEGDLAVVAPATAMVEEPASGKQEEMEAAEVSQAATVSHKERYEAFLAALAAIDEVDGKLSRTIAFMEAALSTDQGVPYFKNFWEARALALQFFKENSSSSSRTELWNKYAELSKEARRLKEMLDEQSAYAAEQIEIAVRALELEQENAAEQVANAPAQNFLENARSLQEAASYYYSAQGELNFLNAHAGRVTGLRKELIRTDMRVRQKNQFFRRLSQLGDRIFPRRKELIKEISQRFTADIEKFMQENFASDGEIAQPFALRAEIQALQNVAKTLTLNTQAFSYARSRLSEAWEKIKVVDKERKKERVQQKQYYRHNKELFLEQLATLKDTLEAAEVPIATVRQQLDDISREIQRTPLGRDDLTALREVYAPLRQVVTDRLAAEEQERLQRIQERDQQRKAAVDQYKGEIAALLAVEDADISAVEAARDSLAERLHTVQLSRLEKQEFDRLLKQVRDALADRREKALLSLPDSDRQAILQLKMFLKERQEQRQEVKAQLEQYRKMKSASTLDFEKAMELSNQMADDKERLGKISAAIGEIESKLLELERRAAQ